MIIGVTGVFGSGKSTVSRMLAKRMKCRIMDADRLAWRAFQRNKTKIKRLFGTADRKKLAKIVFDDKKKLAQLQKIIHPYVISKMRKEARRRKNAVMDVPLLIEAGAHRLADVVIVVRCAERVRIKRLLKKGFKRNEIEQRTRQQMPTGKKIRYAHYVVDNGKSITDTKRQVDGILKKINRGKR